jgi:hypothetical protein
MFYRLRQLYSAIWSTVRPEEYRWVRKILSEKEYRLFLSQALPDQRHALDVALDIKTQADRIEKTYGRDACLSLLQAALLHDCGKALSPPRLWQRILIVTAGFFPQNHGRKIGGYGLFGETLPLYHEHPLWGRNLAAEAGCSHQVLALIEHHHAPESPLEKILSEPTAGIKQQQ